MANEVLIIKGNLRLSASTLGNLRTSFQKQIDEGLLVLPYGFDAIYIPEGLKCEIVCEEDKNE